MLSFAIISKHKDKIRNYCYKYTQRVIEYSLENDRGSYWLFFALSFLATESIVLLLYLVPDSSFRNIIPLENVSEILGNSIHAISDTMKSILMPYGISIVYGPDYNRNLMIYFSMLITGPSLMFLLKQLRKKHQPVKKEPSSTNKSWQKMKKFIQIIGESGQEKYPGSKSLLIFFYVGGLILIQQFLVPTANWGVILGWTTTFSMLSSFVILCMILIEYTLIRFLA